MPDLFVPPLNQHPLPPPVPTKPDLEYYLVYNCEEVPELIGGLAALQREVRYPVMAKKAGIEGRVILRFIVDEQGRVSEPKVVRGIGGGCDEEALRALQTVRFWPGTQRGKPVKVKMSLPITFRLGQ